MLIGLLAVLLAYMTAYLVDQPERQLAEIQKIHVSGETSPRAKWEKESDIAARLEVQKHLNEEAINFQYFDLTDRGLVCVKRMPHLKMLTLSFSKITDAGLPSLVNIPLTDLVLNDTSISSDGMKYVSQIKTLERLNMSSTSVGDAGLELLKQLPVLTKLNLNNTPITDAGIRHLPCHSGMTNLWLGLTNITDKSVPDLAKLHHLAWLELDGTEITANGLNGFASSKNLLGLSVKNCPHISKAEAQAFKKKLPSCRVYTN